MTNLQQFVFEYLEAQKKDSSIDSCIFADVGRLAKAVLDYHKSEKNIDWSRVAQVREKIAEFSLTFAKKLEDIGSDGLSSIYGKIDELQLADPRQAVVLMSAHQPNLFAYSGVLKKVALMASVAGQIRTSLSGETVVCFFGFADHDFVNNKWVRSAEIPSPLRKDGVLRYNVRLDRKQLFQPSNSILKPSRETLDLWKNATRSWIEENSTLARKFLRTMSSKACD
ncbi:MAG: hypothetical protein ACREBS_04990, partial [Nitrososphaerales archaeon]